jgi:hypothetical protein
VRVPEIGKPEVDPKSWTLGLERVGVQRRGSMSQRRSFTLKFKAQVWVEILTRAKSPAQACREYHHQRLAPFPVAKGVPAAGTPSVQKPGGEPKQ